MCDFSPALLGSYDISLEDPKKTDDKKSGHLKMLGPGEILPLSSSPLVRPADQLIIFQSWQISRVHFFGSGPSKNLLRYGPVRFQLSPYLDLYFRNIYVLLATSALQCCHRHFLIFCADDETRVKINTEKGDYINASFIEVGQALL